MLICALDSLYPRCFPAILLRFKKTLLAGENPAFSQATESFMHLNLKHIVVVGLVVVGAETVWRRVSNKPLIPESDDKAMVAFARESTPTSFGAPVVVTNWQAQVSQVLSSHSPAPDQGNTLVAMLPQTPAEGQVDVAQHASRLLSDASFASFGSQLTNAATPAAVRRVVFADLLSRPNSVKLPWLIEVAKSPVDNQSGEALLILKSILREDYGTDWKAWRERAVIWMMENP